MIPIIMILCSIGGTTYGMAEETIAFYPLIIPVLIAAGYDVVVGVMVVFLGAGVGIAGGLINPFSVGIASSLAGISLGDGIFVRLLLYVCYLVFAIIFVMRYAQKVRMDPKKSIVYDIKEKVEKPFKRSDSGDLIVLTTRRKLALLIFGSMFFIMILGIIPWGEKFGIHLFEKAHHFLLNLPFLGSFIGNMPAIGAWYFKEMTILFFLGAVLIGKVYGMREAEIVRLFILGCKDILSVAITIAVAKGISVIMIEGHIIGTLLHAGEQFLSNMNEAIFPAITYFVYIGLSFFIPSSSGLAAATIPIIAPLGDFLGIAKEYIVMVCQAGAETMNFMSPTQAVLIGALALTNIPYDRWLRHIIPFVLGMMTITVVVVTACNLFN